jgi:hypothetical protein
MLADSSPDEASIPRMTFSGDGLMIMLSVDRNSDGTVRLDGWLAPGLRYDIEMHCGTNIIRTVSDEAGRFALRRVPRGLARLVVHCLAPNERTVTTPIVEM